MMLDFAGNASPMPDCSKGMAHKACVVHVSSVALISPSPSSVWNRVGQTDWVAQPPSSMTDTGFPPDTPPPIVLL